MVLGPWKMFVSCFFIIKQVCQSSVETHGLDRKATKLFYFLSINPQYYTSNLILLPVQYKRMEKNVGAHLIVYHILGQNIQSRSKTAPTYKWYEGDLTLLQIFETIGKHNLLAFLINEFHFNKHFKMYKLVICGIISIKFLLLIYC